MFALNRLLPFVSAFAFAAILQSTASGQLTIGQSAGTDFIAFEAEDVFEIVNGDDETGWRIIGADEVFKDSSNSATLEAGTTSRNSVIYDIPGGSVNDFLRWRLQFVEPGDYSLYLLFSMYDRNGDGSYGNEDSIYISSEFGTNGELVDTPADPRGDRDSMPSYYGNPSSGGGNNEGLYLWWNAEVDGSDSTTTNVGGVYTPELNTALDFGIATREAGFTIDKVVFHLNPDLTDEELDALPTFAPGSGDPGDYNADGAVDLEDFLILSQNLTQSFSLIDSFEKGDETRDGKVDLFDFVAFREVLASQAGPPPVSIPEPSTFMPLLGMGTMLVLATRRRRKKA